MVLGIPLGSNTHHTLGSSIALMVSVAHAEESFWAAASVSLGIAYWSVSVGLTILFTSLIIIKLLIGRRNIRGINGGLSATYLTVVSMLVESAALYSGWALVFLITYARGSAIQNILLPPLGQIQVRYSYMPSSS